MPSLTGLFPDLTQKLDCHPINNQKQGLFLLQGSFTGGFTPKWLLGECRMALERIARSGKPQAMLAAGALAGLSGAFSACQVSRRRLPASWQALVHLH